MGLALDPGIAELVWYGTEKLRLRAHLTYGTSSCPSRSTPYVGGFSGSQVCRDDGCIGVMHEVYAGTVSRLSQSSAAHEIASRLAYARRIVATQVADLERSRRVARGMPAKPTRSDGIAGRIIAALTADCPSQERAVWLTALFRMMRGYACRDQRTSSEWPLDMWAAEKTRIDGQLRLVGSTGVRAEVRGDIATVLNTSERIAGRRWVMDTILHPLLMVRVPLAEELERWIPALESPLVDHILAGQVQARFAELTAAGLDAQSAWRRSVRDITGQEPVDEVWTVLDDLHGHSRVGSGTRRRRATS